jgi:hypothetical protein
MSLPAPLAAVFAVASSFDQATPRFTKVMPGGVALAFGDIFPPFAMHVAELTCCSVRALRQPTRLLV